MQKESSPSLLPLDSPWPHCPLKCASWSSKEGIPAGPWLTRQLPGSLSALHSAATASPEGEPEQLRQG